jgi:hypothetical protein
MAFRPKEIKMKKLLVLCVLSAMTVSLYGAATGTSQKLAEQMRADVLGEIERLNLSPDEREMFIDMALGADAITKRNRFGATDLGLIARKAILLSQFNNLAKISPDWAAHIEAQKHQVMNATDDDKLDAMGLGIGIGPGL